MSDPYQPASPQPQPARSAALYSTQGIVMGTILGSLAAGVVMLYLNYLALGRANLARTVITWGAALFVAVIMIASYGPSSRQP